MSRPHPTSESINLSYHPGGSGSSASLRRARQPFRFGNALIGLSIAGFGLGVYVYSIAAVKQDDFSDVEDLLPPLAERSKLRSIEDEERERLALTDPTSTNTLAVPSSAGLQTSSPSALSPGIPSTSSSPSPAQVHSQPLGQVGEQDRTLVGRFLPRRLSELSWVRNAGLVETGTENVIVWGAPEVDRLGRMQETVAGAKGLRVV